ncbi:hypothetical protein PG988_005659 [Apiospora saccharicola]
MDTIYNSDKIAASDDLNKGELPAPAPNHNDRRPGLVGYWDDQWKSPNPRSSRFCLKASLFVACLLAVAPTVLKFVFAAVPAAAAAWTEGAASPQSFWLTFTTILSQQHGQAKEAWICFAISKAICLSSEIVLLVTHSRLRQQYRNPFRAHMSIRVGIYCACWLPLFCYPAYQQYEFGMALVTYQLETCFWVGYWIEWWTGITLRINLAIFGDLAEI